jgi:3-hexulose-6-phosphate synthase/6-phospho-3-hexuloisomerase
MKPVLQLALDFVDLPRAIKVAEEAVIGGVDWLEVGTPLIKSAGMEAVRKVKELFPKKTVVADMKTLDTGRIEVEMALKSGAEVVAILALASDVTIRECIESAKNYGGQIMVDLINIKNVIARAKEVEELGADYLSVHIPIDEQMRGRVSFEKLSQVVKNSHLPVAIAGGINSETVVDAISVGASIIIVGGAISKAGNATQATQQIKKALKSGVKIRTTLFKRVSSEEVREILQKVSTANISDAFHRGGMVPEVFPIFKPVKMVGPVLTVRTYPGDWAKPVEAIDQADEQSVIVVDAGGVGPAVWGELATHSALQKKLAGVVINGAIRDTGEIRQLKFPAFAKLIQPQAGEPKGFGEIGVPIKIGGISVSSGDWMVGDDDGLVVIPRQKVTEITNRAMDVLERENRIRREIQEGTTLSQVTELLRWEKK